MITNDEFLNACKTGDLSIVKQGLAQGVDPSDDNNYAIRWASRNGHTETVRLLLQDNRVDPSDDNNYAIGVASENGHIEVVKLLLQDNRVDPSDDNNYAIRWASENGHTEIVKLLEHVISLKRGNRRMITKNEFLKACRTGDISTVKQGLAQGIDPSVNYNYAIRWASRNGYTEIVRLLLQDNRVDPSEYNWAIGAAVEYGHIEVVKLLLQDSRIDPSDYDRYVIRLASKYGHTEIAKLLEHTISLKKEDRLMITEEKFLDACRTGDLCVVKQGLAQGIDPSDDNNHAIACASHNGRIEVVRLLLQDSRVDPSDCNNYAIGLASKYGHIEVVRLLLKDDRVDPSDDNNFAIRWASENGHTEIAKLLEHVISSKDIPQNTDKSISTQTQEERTMKETLTKKAHEVVDFLTPYKKYLLALAVLVIIDHFFLDGRFRKEISAYVERVALRLKSIVDKGLDKVLGDKDNG